MSVQPSEWLEYLSDTLNTREHIFLFSLNRILWNRDRDLNWTSTKSQDFETFLALKISPISPSKSEGISLINSSVEQRRISLILLTITLIKEEWKTPIHFYYWRCLVSSSVYFYLSVELYKRRQSLNFSELPAKNSFTKNSFFCLFFSRWWSFDCITSRIEEVITSHRSQTILRKISASFPYLLHIPFDYITWHIELCQRSLNSRLPSLLKF